MNEEPLPVLLTCEFSQAVAWDLAQFVKRVGWDDCYRLTEAHLSDDERREKAYRMIAGIDTVGAALAKAGFAPR